MTPQRPIAVELEGATLQLGRRVLWQDLDLKIEPGSFVAVLGPNGAGKTTMLEVLLGLRPLTAGRVTVGGEAPRRGDHRIGYVPQQRAFERGLPIRGRDLVRLGLDGPRFGFSRLQSHDRAQIDEALATVGALGYADAPIGLLSGGEQQRLRIAQALLGDRSLLLCDEPLLSLDPSHQHEVTALLDRRRRELGISVVFVTHEINPVLPYVDTVLYLTNGRWAAGTPDEIFTSPRLSALYGTSIDVLRVRDRIVVVGTEEDDHGCHPMPAAADA